MSEEDGTTGEREALQAARAALEAEDIDALRTHVAARPSLALACGADGDTLLHWACHRKLAAAVELLLAAGAWPNARGFNGRRPLHAAVNDSDARRAAPIVRLLLAHGADPIIENDGGFSAIAWARQEIWAPQDEVMKLLGAARSPPAATVDDGSYDAAVAQARAIETRAHTSLALFQLLKAHAAGAEPPSVAHLFPDVGALAEARAVLAALDATSWGPAVREWLGESLKPAYVQRMVELRAAKRDG